MQPEFYRTKLKNGMIVLFEKRSLPIVDSLLAFRYGYAYEPARYKGIAHYIEHCIFQGTEKKDLKQISEIIEKKGGSLNGFTIDEVTAFYAKLPSEYLGLSIGIITDMLTNPAFKQDKIEKEKNVVIEEARGYHDKPEFYVLDKIRSFLYKKPFGLAGIGTKKTIKNFSRDTILKFFSLYNNPILCIVGKANFDDILDFARKIPVKEKPFPKLKTEKTNKQAIEKRKGLEQAHLILGFHVSTLKEKARYALESFNTILADGMSSRLFQEIRDKGGLAYHIKDYAERGADFGYNLFYIGTEKKNVKKVKEILLKEIKKMQELQAKDFEESKEHLIGKYKLMQENSENTLLALLEEELAGNASEFYKYEQRISELKLLEVRKLGNLKNYSFLALVPE
jgi:predicted Zn-dependent peptidase